MTMAPHLISAAGFLAIGFLAGVIHYAGLRWNTRFYTAAPHPAWAVGFQLARLAITAGLLILIAFHGALALLLAAAGLVLARPVVVRYCVGD